MKNIEINEKQKGNLLEMCKELFPEYFYWEISKKQFIQSHIIGNDTEIYEGEKPDLNIHWFEFCMTHLKDKLQYKLEKVSKLDYDYQMKAYDSWWESHPIDYLYEEFKKIINV